MWPSMVYLPLLLLLCASPSEACSSRLRNRNRPRPTDPTPAATTVRPSISYPTFDCPPLLEQVFCLNNAKCVAAKVGDGVEYFCNCSEGFMGRRCEHKYVDIDGELLSQLSVQETLFEYAGVAGASTYILFLALAVGLWYYMRRRRNRISSEMQDVDQVDGPAYERPRPFGPRVVDMSMERLVKKAPSSKKNGR
ncbi:hypothetical protein ONE63_006955 [Megalurothrips usitatus]|uniref:EGF-like domain-containing protein n=1 Tax=Megalurothrips usitatus TaxID=439358 RepID=A0AAV7XTT9_9NEOP|nr:hypothetical protein ONE63_006955 [Megalurothrips usitatus]